MRIKFGTILHLIFLLILCSCGNSGNRAGSTPVFSSYREIPGITNSEITAIEMLRMQSNIYTYGMMTSPEAFENQNGEVRGYAALLCEWLSRLFGMRFVPRLYEWHDLRLGLETGEISFTGELTLTEERLKTFHMTSAIASRPFKYFRIEGSMPLSEIEHARPLRIAFFYDTTTYDFAAPHLPEGFVPVYIDSFEEAYNVLKSGEADAFIDENAAEFSFDVYRDVISIDFFPLLYTPVSLSTQNPSLVSIISVVQKALHSDGARHFAQLYNAGYQEYIKYKLLMQLTEEEKAFIQSNPIINVAAEVSNYPVSFYNNSEDQWQGIAFDIFDELEKLLGLRFRRINNRYATWTELYGMLERGEASMVSELMRIAEREGNFLWMDTTFMDTHMALISAIDYPNVTLNEIIYTRVGLFEGYANSLFKQWFPNHFFTVEFASNLDAFNALERGEIDLVMASSHDLLILSHFLERTGYKINFKFNHLFQSTFGFNKNETVLHSIINKAIRFVDTDAISNYWMSRTFDYRSKVAQARTPWIIGAAILFVFVVALFAVLFIRSRRVGKELESLVEKRTYELKVMERAAQAASQSKSAFLANMSHEIRTPMNAILGVTEILIQYETLPVEIEEGLEKIYSSCDLLLGIINDILDFSKIEAGKLDILPHQYKIASMINDSVHLNMMRIESKPIEFELQINENIPAKLIGDELRIKQILNNLLSNAFKYTESGKVTLTVDFEKQAERDKDSENDEQTVLVLSVRDTGYGMTREQLSRMFDEYARFHQKIGKTTEGTGLGLAIAQRLINLMKGHMHVDSQVGVGSFFIVKLPQGIVDDKMLGKEVADNLCKFRESYMSRRKKGQVSRDPMPYGKVLIVDDVETNVYVAVGLMKLYKLQIDTAMSGDEAVNKIKEGKKYDVIFMDHMMPEMDGMEAVKIIRGLRYEEPIVALTANAVSGQADMFLNNGFDDFISKPIDIRQLNSVLNQYVRDKQTQDVIEAARSLKSKNDKRDESNPRIDTSLIESFIRDANKTVDLLVALYNTDEFDNEENLRKFTVIVHGIKSSLWNIGEMELADTAYKLEKSGREKNKDKIASLTPGFLGGIRTLLRKLNEKIESEQGANSADTSIDDLCGKLNIVKEKAAGYDRKGVLDVISQIKSNSKETKAVLDKIMECAIHSEFEEAENAADALIFKLSNENKT